jgi:hypothetical protein
MNGTASVGGRTCSRIAPATAEKAKPAKPETTAPEKTAKAMSVYEVSMGGSLSVSRRA